MSDIDVGEGWRRLKPGEVIQEGDQWLASCGNTWYDTESVGRKVGESGPLLYRRRHSPEVAALSSGLSALAARVEKIEAAAYAQGMAATFVIYLTSERDEARKECKKLSAANYALDGVVTALEARVSELKKELKLAKEANAGGFSNQPAVSGDGKSAEGGNQEPVKYAVVVGGKMENYVYDDSLAARERASEIACRGTPHFVGVVALYREPPRPAGWLTDEDRRAVAFAAKVFRGHTIVGPLRENADQLDGLLDRRLAPKVRRPTPWHFHTDEAEDKGKQASRDRQWEGAIREAGVEVDD